MKLRSWMWSGKATCTLMSFSGVCGLDMRPDTISGFRLWLWLWSVNTRMPLSSFDRNEFRIRWIIYFQWKLFECLKAGTQSLFTWLRFIFCFFFLLDLQVNRHIFNQSASLWIYISLDSLFATNFGVSCWPNNKMQVANVLPGSWKLCLFLYR